MYLKSFLYKNYKLKYNHHAHDSSPGLFLFMHGLGDSSKSFSKIIDYVYSIGYDVFYYDLPGCGINNSILIDFEENLEILSNFITKFKNDYSIINFIGHSFGGLITLITLIKFNLDNKDYMNILSIEPSITEGDSKFFKLIKEPPLGIGLEGLKNFIRDEKDIYSRTYENNLKVMAQVAFKNYVNDINNNFYDYQNEVLNSELKFIYVFGKNSPDVEIRMKMNQYPNIEVVGFDGAKHWVHIDSEKDFIKFMNNRFMPNE